MSRTLLWPILYEEGAKKHFLIFKGLKSETKKDHKRPAKQIPLKKMLTDLQEIVIIS